MKPAPGLLEDIVGGGEDLTPHIRSSTYPLKELQTIGPMDYWSHGLLVPWTIGPMDYWSHGLLVQHGKTICTGFFGRPPTLA